MEASATSEAGGEQVSATQFFENFMFKETELRIKQDTCVGHNAVLWDAARVLAKYFEYSPTEYSGKKVLDLGSGCGLTGICLATLDASVTVTELPERTQLLKDNVMANVPDKGVVVRECVWGEVGTTTPWGKVDDFGNNWDYITGSDLIYSDESTPALVQTLIHCCAPRTEIIISQELRRQKDLDFFAQLGANGFGFVKLDKKDLHPVYQADEIAVFRIWRQ